MYVCMYVYISITKLPKEAYDSWQGARLGRLATRDLGAFAGSIWPRLARCGCLWRLAGSSCLEKCPGWLDLAALRAPGRPAGSIWLLEKRGPVQRNVDFAAQGQCFVDVALVASIWVLCALLGALAASMGRS